MELKKNNIMNSLEIMKLLFYFCYYTYCHNFINFALVFISKFFC